jgi:predicted TIM-barrel fold metal-dependent hydrolase
MMDRLDEKYQGDRRRRSIALKKLPSEYIRSGNIYFSCELDERTLDVVVRELGEDLLMYPSDFPHEKSRGEFTEDIPAFLKRDDLSDIVKRKVLYDNAKRFYRL